MKYYFSLLLLLFLCTCVLAQPEPEPTMVSVAKVSGFSGSNGTYTGTLGISDVYNTGYSGMALSVGDRFIDALGRVYEITSISSPTVFKVTVVLNCLSDPVGSPIGTGQIWRPLASGAYPSAPARDGELGAYLVGLIQSHNATVASKEVETAEALSFRDTTMALSGLTVSLTISGTAPTLSGSPGGYTLTVPEGTDWKNLQLSGGPLATSNNDLSFSIVNAAGSASRAGVTLVNTGNNEVVTAPKQEFGIITSQSVSGNTLLSSFTNIGGLAGFILYLSR